MRRLLLASIASLAALAAAPLASGQTLKVVMHSDLKPKRGDLSCVKGRSIGAAPWVDMGLRGLLKASGIDLERDGVRIAPVPGATGATLARASDGCANQTA